MNRSILFLLTVGILSSLLGGSSALATSESTRGGTIVGCFPPPWYHECEIEPIPTPRHDTSVLALKKTDVSIRVLGPFAEVEVIQYYHNPANFPITVGYTFPLPENAAIRDLEMVTGNRVLRADLKEREEARQIYNEAEQSGHGAALVEQVRENMFRSRIANVMPKQDIAIRIKYSQRVPIQAGQYRLLFPTVVAPRYCPANESESSLFDLPYVPSGMPGHSIGINAVVNAGAPLISIGSVTHSITVTNGQNGVTTVDLAKSNEIPNRDFVLTWKVADDATRAMLWTGAASADIGAVEGRAARDGDGTPFMLVAYPKRQTQADNSPREIVFILDSSGSMSGAKFEAAKKALKGLLRSLSARDRFRLVEFDDDFTELSRNALEFNQQALDKADAWIDAISDDGGTEILKPIQHVFSSSMRRASDRNVKRIVILLTDGQVSNEDEVLREVTRNVGNDRVFTMGIDYAVNDAMLKAMARVGKGSCILMTPDEDIEGAVLSLSNRFNTPALADITLTLGGARLTLIPNPIPDLYYGEPLVVLGRMNGGVGGSAMLKAMNGAAPWQDELELVAVNGDSMNLDAIVAEKEIEELGDKMRRGDFNELKKQIVELSLRSRVASQYTAFVVVETREERTDTGLVRKVEVPVAFPHGWNWNTVFGAEEAECFDACKVNYSMMPAAPSTGFGRGLASYAPAPSPGGAARARRDVSAGTSASQSISHHTLALRYLARTQRASGLWLANGNEDVRTSALAVIGLLSDYSTYRGNIDRAMSALHAADLTREDATTKAIVKAALLAAHQATGDAGMKTAADAIQISSVAGVSELPALAQSSKAEDLSKLAAAVLLSNSDATSKQAAAAKLEALTATSGASAGQVNLSGCDTTLSTALYAALGY